MARTLLTLQTLEGDVMGANGLLATLNNGDVANGNAITFSGREIIIAYNAHASTAYDVTIKGPADRNLRTGDVVEEVPAGGFAIFGPTNGITEGWKQSDGRLYIDVEDASIKLIALQLPAN